MFYDKSAADQLLALKANSADLSKVATSGSYNDLLNKPTNVSDFTNDSGYLNFTGAAQLFYDKSAADQLLALKANSADLAKVATSGSYNDLLNKPTNVSDFTNDANYLNYTGAAQLFYDKAAADQLLALKANSADLAKVATSGSYNDLKNKPHIPNDQVQADWCETGTGEPSYIKNKPNLATVATSGSYNDLSNKPTNVSDFTNDSGYLNYTDAAQLFYDKTQADDKFLARYRKIQLSAEPLGEGDDAETWHGVGKFWTPVNVYWGSGADDYWQTTGYEFPEAYDSSNDNYYVKINNVHAGDEIAFLNMLLKETPSSTPHILIINNSGTTVWSEEIPVNSQTNTSTLYTSYTFESDYDYIIIGTDCDKPAYVQKIEYYVPLADNSDLGYVIPTISQVQGELGNKVNYWDIVQSDWEQSDTGAKDYIKNKPNLATVATSGSYNDLSNKPTKVSEFANDAGYLTKHQSLANCVQSTTANLKIEVVSKMPASPQNNTLYIVQ